MQEIKKRRIVITSVLKPVDEPRMFERMGRSLANHGFDVFIIGSSPAAEARRQGIHFLAHDKIKRISFKRVTIRLAILKKIFALKPDVLIVATHELIGTALFYKLVTGRKIIYDVQENYYLNILCTNAFPKSMRWCVAASVRMKETIASFFFDRFFLAEKCFASELPFTKRKAVVIENKCHLTFDTNSKSDRQKNDGIELIFTGTLAESTGVFQAIDLAQKLNAINAKVSLKIIGYCAQAKTMARIENAIAKNNFISLVGGANFISHQIILEAIRTANFGIIYYPDSPHTRDRIPSKLYEYLACQLPILSPNNPAWITLVENYKAGVKVDFVSPDINALLQEMTSTSFYSALPMEALWETEEKKLIDTVHAL